MFFYLRTLIGFFLLATPRSYIHCHYVHQSNLYCVFSGVVHLRIETQKFLQVSIFQYKIFVHRGTLRNIATQLKNMQEVSPFLYKFHIKFEATRKNSSILG